MGEIQPQLPAIGRLPRENLSRELRALDVDELRVDKASRLTCPLVDRDAHIDHVRDVLEQILEVTICHFVREVADEERAGGWHGLARARVGLREVHDEPAAFEDFQVHLLLGALRGLDGVERHVAESIHNRK